MVFKVMAIGHFKELLSFPGYLSYIQKVYMLLNFCLSPVNLLLQVGDVSAKNIEG